MCNDLLYLFTNSSKQIKPTTMENQNASVKKIALTYGLLLGLFSVLLSVVLYAMDSHLERPGWASFLSFAVTLALIVYGLKTFKKENEGYMSLGQALKTGVAISLIAGIIGAIFNYIFVTMIEPDFVNQMLELTRENMLENNPEMTDEQVEMGLSITEKMMQPWIMSALAIIVSMFFGFIISLIAGLIMKQNRPEV